MHGSLLLLGLSGPEITVEEAALFRRIQPTGFILFSRNIVSPQQTRKLTDDLRELSEEVPIIAIDQEGGRVTRTKDIAPALPSATDLAVHGQPHVIANAGAFTGDLLSLLGFNLNCAPVLDLEHHPDKQTALRGRCWGRDPQRVIDHAGMWNRWMRKRSIRSCGKHFPACGRAISDPHFDLPVSEATLTDLLKEDVIPYTALMPELDSIMLAHVEFPNIDAEFPASLSKRIIRGFLRNQLGFDHHVVMTDDLDMGAITRRYPRGEDVRFAIEAGNDLALICHRIDSADVAVEALKDLPITLVDEALARISRLRKKLSEPTIWSEKKWASTCDSIAALKASVPETDVQSSSPVTGY